MKHYFSRLLLMVMFIPWVLQAQTTPAPASLPYSCGFEDATENNNWVIVNGTATNKFCIGQADPSTGAKSLYISNDNGVTNAYTFSGATNVYAYREITVSQAGVYNVSFDWRNVGEQLTTTTYDYLRVLLVPSSIELPAGLASSSLPTGLSYSATPEGWISADLGRGLVSEYTWQHLVNDEVVLDQGNYKLIVLWRNDASGGENPPGNVDNISINAVACPKPSGLAITALTESSVSIAWNITPTNSFKYWLDTANAPLRYSADATALTGNTITLNSLQPNTEYTFHIQSICNGDTTDWKTIDFRTKCVAITNAQLPWQESFETWVAGNFDPCYVAENTSTAAYPSINTTNYSDGTKSLYMYSTAAYATWLAMPAFEAPINTLQISFDLKKTAVTEYPFMVGVMTDPNDFSTFEAITMVSNHLKDTFLHFNIPLVNYQGQGRHIALVSPNGVASYNYLDNVVVSVLPACPDPLDLTAVAASPTSILVEWTTTGASGYTIEYGAPGFELGTGTSVAATAGTHTLTGLTPNSSYEIYLRSTCGTTWLGPVAVHTPCTAIPAANLPYMETFDSYTGAIATSTSAPTGYPNHAMPDCWNFFGMSQSSSSNPKAFLTSSTTYAQNGNCLFLMSYNTPMYAVLPKIDVDINSLQLSFAYRNENATSGTLIVGVMSTLDTATFVGLDTIENSTTKTTAFHQFWNDGLSAGSYYIAFRWIHSNTTSFYVGIDSIKVDYLPACPDPFNIEVASVSDQSATISWAGNASGYIARYVENGEDMYSPLAVSQTLTGSTITLTGLTAATAYDFYLRSNCGTDTGNWMGPLTFRTECPAFFDISTNAYTEDFDSYTAATSNYTYAATNETPVCWEMRSNGTNGPTDAYWPRIYKGTSYCPTSNNNALLLNATYYTSTPSYTTQRGNVKMAVLPTFSEPLYNTTIAFDARFGSASSSYTDSLFVAIATGDTTFVPLAYFANPTSSATATIAVEVDLNNYQSIIQNNPNGRLAIVFKTGNYSSSSTRYLGIDNVVVSKRSDCAKPYNAMIVDIDEYSATFAFSDSLNTNNYEVIWSTTNDVDFAQTENNVEYYSDTTGVIGNLTPSTMYCAWVRANCGGSSSQWVEIGGFRTLCIALDTLPFIETFDSYTEGVSTSTAAPTGYPAHTLPTCWNFVNMSSTSSAYPQAFITSNSGYALNGSKALFFKSAMHKSIFAVMPKIQADLSELQLTFHYRNESLTATNGTLSVGLMSSAIDTNTFVELASFPVINTLTPAIVQFWSADSLFTNNEEYHIAFRYTGSTNNNMWLSIDSVVVDYLPTCPDPTNIVAVVEDAQSATISWVGNANGYIVEYGVSGYIRGTGTMEYPYENALTISGLNGNTVYDVYLRSDCSDIDTGNWIGPITFRTDCPEVFDISETPYFEDFNLYTASTSNYTYAATNETPGCWDIYSNGTNGPTAAYWPRIYKGTSYCPTSNDNALLMYVCNYTGTTASSLGYVTERGTEKMAVLPPVSEPLSNVTISFDAKVYTVSTSVIDTIFIAIPTSDSTYIPLAHYEGISGLIEIEENLANYASAFDTIENPRVAIVFKASTYTTSSLRSNYLGIDNVQIAKNSSCPHPSNAVITSVTSNSASFSFSDTANVGSYEIAWATVNDVTLAENSEVYSDTVGTIDNLETSTTYYAWVRANCGSVYSNWEVLGSFKTTCLSIDTLPYYEDFNSYSGNMISTSASVPTGYPNHTTPDCWSLNINDGTKIFLSTNNSYIVDGNCLFFTGTNAAPGYAVLPNFSIPIESMLLEFTYRYENVSYGKAIIGAMTNPYDESTFIALDTLEPTNTLTRASHAFWGDTLTGTNYYIAIKWHNATTTTVYYFAIDNLSITAPACHYVADAVTSNITPTSVDLSWTNTGADSFVVAYSTTSSFDPETCTTTINTTADSITINNLTPYTKYYYTVKAVCGSEQASWSEVASFITLQDCGNLDLVEPVIGDTSLTTNSSSYPFYTSTSYTRGISWQIYEQTELEMQGVYSGNINSIAYDYYSATPLKGFFNIYVTEIDSTEFASSYDTIATSNMTLVYSDSILFEKGWNTIIFNNAYNYSGTQNLVVAIERVGTINYAGSFVYTAGTAATTGYKTIYGYTNSSGTTSSTRTYNRSNVIFNICTATPSCERPADVVVSNVQATQVDVAWTHEGNNFTVAYGPRGFSLDSTATYQTAQATTTSTTITGLNEATSYDVYVRANCNGETSDWSFVESFTTICLPISTLPYIEDFDSYTTDIVTSTTAPTSYPEHTMPSCWSFLNLSETAGSNYPQAFLTSHTTYATSGNCLFFKSKKAASVFSVLPKFDIDIDTLQISFTYRNEGTTTSNGTLSLGVMTDIADTASFIELAVFDKTTTNTRVEHIFTFDSLSGTNYTIAFRYCGGTTNNYYLSIDSVVVDYIPSCLKPYDITSNNRTQTSADLTWQSVGGSTWEVEYGPRGFERGQGTIVYTNTTSYTITGLTHSSHYDVYVRSICGAGDTSEVSDLYRFRTGCGAIDSLPWSANLDGVWYYYTNNPTALYPTCWDIIDGGYESTSTKYNWRYNNSNAMTGNTAIYFYGYASTSATYEHNDWLITPEMPLTGNEQLSFWMKNSSSSTTASYEAKVAIYAYTVDPNDSVVTTADYVQVGSYISMHGTGANTYTEHIVPLTGLTGNVKLAFVVNTNSYSFYIDDVTVEEIPACPRPRFLEVDSVNQNSITLTWNSTATDFVVDYKKSSDSVWSTITGIWDTTATLTNLSPSTTYQIRVKAVCTAVDSSSWSDILEVATECGPTHLPFFEDFSATTFPANCWERFSGIPFINPPTSTTAGWTRVTTNYGLQGPHTKVDLYSNYRRGLVTPALDLSNEAAAQLSFDIALTDDSNGNAPDSISDDDKFMILVSTDNGATWPEANAVIWGSDTSDNYDISSLSHTVQRITVDLSQYYGDTIKIAFYSHSMVTNSSNDIHIDNILVQTGCPAPVISSVVPEATTATINWTASATNFQVAYKEAAATDWGAEIDVTNATTYTITGLMPETDYMVRVRSICEDGEMSMWRESTFTTPELPCIVPTNVTATDITYTSANIGWTASGNEVSWEVRYATGGVEDTIVATTNPVAITGLFSASTYQVWVRAFCGADTYSEWSEVYTFNTQACATVSNVVVSEIGGNNATVTWTPAEGQTAWEVSYGMQGFSEGYAIATVTVTNPTYQITGLETDTPYDVYVRAICDEDVYSAWSERVTFTTTEDECNPVSNVTANNITETSATITWTPTGNETKWQVAYCLASDATIVGEDATIVDVENTPSYTITGLETRTSYDAFVRTVCNETNYSAWVKVNFTTLGIGINTAANDNVSVRIYPNPANTQATISVEGVNGKVEFVVADMNGRMIVTETINCNGELVKTIDVSNLAKGAYFVHIYNDNINTTRKLIVK